MPAWVSSVVGAILGLYLVYAAAMVALHPRFIYPFFDAPFEAEGFEQVRVNAVARAYVSKAKAGAPVIVYFMGNAGSLAAFEPMLKHHQDQGRNVAALAYRGGGGMPGQPSEGRLKQDALDLIDMLPDLVPEGPVLVQGYSLGTGLALHVAANRTVDALVLSAPYDKLCRLMARSSFLPACILPVQHWNAGRDAAQVTERSLVLHGAEDALIPISEGVRLARRLTNAEFLRIEGAGHTDLLQFPGYLRALDAFIASDI